MNYGVQQQKDAPQKVYEEPCNLFVAKFLGNPPINVIDGIVENKEIKLLNGTVIGKIEAADQKVKLGIRPEFVTLDGKLNVDIQVEMVEHIGRDTMAICKLEGYEDTMRVIVPSHKKIEADTEVKIAFRRFFVFDYETGERLQ
jgi:multiple sugar transport system ATP-binding protein